MKRWMFVGGAVAALGLAAPIRTAMAQAPDQTSKTEVKKADSSPKPGPSGVLRRTKFTDRIKAMRNQLEAKNRIPVSRSRLQPAGAVDIPPLARSRARQLMRRSASARHAKRQRQATRQLLSQTLGRAPKTDFLKDVLRKSAERRAQLDRIEDLALEAGDEATIERVEQLRLLEKNRLQTYMKQVAQGAEKP